MTQPLTIHLTDAAFAALQSQAKAGDQTPEQAAEAALEQHFGRLLKVDLARRGNIRRFFGSVDLGKSSGADNEAIDADLAKEYGNNHETD